MEQNLCGKTKEEILGMLSTIKEICSKHACDGCPFGASNGICYFNYNPNVWNLHNEDYVWRAFK